MAHLLHTPKLVSKLSKLLKSTPFSLLHSHYLSSKHISLQSDRIQTLSEIFNKKFKNYFLDFIIKSQLVSHSASQARKSKKVSQLLTALNNFRLNFLSKALKMIELQFISRRNQEKLYLNLALKTVYLIKSKRNSFKNEVFCMLSDLCTNFEDKKAVLERILIKEYYRRLRDNFHRYRAEVMSIRINRSMIDTSIKILKLAVEKLDKCQRESKGWAWRKLVYGRREILEDKSILALSRLEILNYSVSVAELNKRILDFTQIGESLLLKRKCYALRKMKAAFSEHFEKLKKRVLYVEANILKKLFFKNKFLCFTQMKFVTDKMKEKKLIDRLNALKKICGPSLKSKIQQAFLKWKKKIRYEKSLALAKGKNIALFKVRKCFTDWRILFFKKRNSKTQIGQGMFKLLKVLSPKVSSAFIALKKYHMMLKSKSSSFILEKQEKAEPKVPKLALHEDFSRKNSSVSEISVFEKTEKTVPKIPLQENLSRKNSVLSDISIGKGDSSFSKNSKRKEKTPTTVISLFE